MRTFGTTLGALIASGLLVAASAATAEATVVNSGTFYNQRTEVNPIIGSECLSGETPGTETITFTDSGTFVQTASGFHVQGTDTVSSRIVYTNGDYSLVAGSSHFSFNTSGTSGQTVSTSAGHELHTIYNSQDEVIARVLFAGVSHTTYRDLNGNGQPDPGEITSTFERLHFTCL
jgi:hypothetical protein